MHREQVLGMRFGELQDLMACDGIYHGMLEEVEKKLTQEQMYELE